MSDIQKANKDFLAAVTAGNQEKEDMVMMMQPFDNMNDQLSAAPLCISILGQLCLISTGRDFSLVDSRVQNQPLKYLTHPNSFRASLCQVSNSGYLAFLEAHRSMDAIKLSTAEVPNLMKQSLEILFNGQVHEVKGYLPITLGRIKTIAENCEKEVQKVVSKYSTIIDTLSELQVCSLNIQGKTEEAKEQARFDAEQKENEIKHINEMKNKIDEDYKKIEKYVDEANQDYREALAKMPTAEELVGLAFADGFKSLIPTVLLSNMLNSFVGSKNEKNDISKGAPNTAQTDLAKGDIYLLSNAKILDENMSKMDYFFCETKEGRELNYKAIEGTWGQTECLTGKNAIHFFDSTLERIARQKDASPNLVKELKSIAKEGKRLASSFVDAKKGSPGDSENLWYKLKAAQNDIQKILTDLNLRFNDLSFHKEGPGMAQASNNTSGNNSSSALDGYVQSCHVKLETTQAQLRKVSERADKTRDKQLQVNTELQESLSRLAKFDAEGKMHEEVLEVLREGLKAFGMLKEQWSKLLIFFQSMANLINVSLGAPLKDFIAHAEKTNENRQLGLDPSEVGKEQIYQTAYQSVKVAYLVHKLSNTYCEISRDHMMPLVSKLGILIAYDKEKDKDKIRTERDDLNTKALEIQETIANIIKSNNETFKSQVNARAKAIKEEFSKTMPGIPLEKENEIKAMVNDAVKKIEISAEYC